MTKDQKIDFFISYAHEDEEIVKELVEALEKSGAKCWYAPRNVIGPYAKSIVEAIERAKVFLLCLSSHSAVSEQVLNEIEVAYNNKRKSNNNIEIEPLCIESLDFDADELDTIMYYIRKVNFITPRNLSSAEDIAHEVLLKNKKLLQIDSVDEKKSGQ